MRKHPVPRLLSFLLLAALGAPAWGAPPASVNVVIEDTKPLVDDDFIYMKIQGDTQYDPVRGRLALDVYLKNNENFAVTIDNVALDWDQPNDPATTLEDSGMEMWCQGVASVMTGTGNLVLPANARCRLGLTPDPFLALPAPAKLRLLVRFVGITASAISPQHDLVDYDNTTAAGSYLFPHKREDLLPGEFWSGRSGISGTHHRFRSYSLDDEVYAYDVGVARFDGTNWVPYTEPDPGETGNQVKDELDEYLAWGKPVYAMADGIVQTCVENNPDNPALQQGGDWNAFTILHGEEIASYGHLQQYSLNDAICFNGAVVHEGDFLGLIGNSGLSGGAPHLHVQVTRNGDPMPLQFHDCFSVERASNFVDPPNGNAPWSAHRGYGLSNTPIVLWPSGLRRRGQAVGSAASEVAITALDNNYSLTAIKNGSNNLALSLWNTGPDGEAQLLDTETGGAVSKVALAVPTGTTDAGLAMITAAGNLKISAVSATTTSVTRTANSDWIAAKTVSAASAPFTHGMATAVVTSSDLLRVTAWEVDPVGASVTRLDEIAGPAAKDAKVVRTIGFAGVAVAIRDSTDDLRLLTYSITGGGSTVDLEDQETDDEVKAFSLVRVGSRGNGDDLVVTASALDADDSLQLISWSIDGSGIISKLDEASAGAIAEVSASRLAISDNEHFLTAVTDSGGDFKLIAWHVADDGTITRRADAEGGEATHLAQADMRQISSSNPALATSAMVDDGGDLRLIVHQVNLTKY